MAEQTAPQTMRLVLTKPSTFSFNGQNGPVTGYKFVSLDGEEFNTFSKDFVEAFEKAGLVGKEQDYLVTPNSNPKYPAKLVGIPGVWDRPQGRGKWGGQSGPMFTDRQAALLAAVLLQQGVQPEVTLAAAEVFASWLGKGAAAPPGAATRSDDGATSPANTSNGQAADGAEAYLRTLAVGVWPNKPTVVDKFFDAILKEFDAPTLSMLTEEEVQTVSDRLEAMKS